MADVFIVPTTGHQSVILRDTDATYMFAGDTSYREQFIIDGVIDGVTNVQVARDTVAKIQKFLGTEQVVKTKDHRERSAQ